MYACIYARTELAHVARTYRHGQPIPRIDYSPEEVGIVCALWLVGRVFLCGLFGVSLALGVCRGFLPSLQ